MRQQGVGGSYEHKGGIGDAEPSGKQLGAHPKKDPRGFCEGTSQHIQATLFFVAQAGARVSQEALSEKVAGSALMLGVRSVVS